MQIGPTRKPLESVAYCVDGRLLLTVTSLYSCPDVCCQVGGVQSQPFTISVGLRQGCVVSHTSLHRLCEL